MVQNINKELEVKQKKVFMKLMVVLCVIVAISVIHYIHPEPFITLISIFLLIASAVFGSGWVTKEM